MSGNTLNSSNSCRMEDPGCFCYENICRCDRGYHLTQNSTCEGELIMHIHQQVIHCSYFLDIDECLNTMVCGKDQICVNTVGSYLCTCAIGFLYNTIEETCDGSLRV